MEIIHIILGKANPNRMNGVNKVVHNLAHHQHALGYDVSVWGITNTPKDINFPNRNYKTVLFQASRYRFKIDPAISEAIATQTKETVFHFHGGFIPEFYSISKLLSKYNFPYVLTPHGSYNSIALKKSQQNKQFYIRLFERKLIQKAASIHCLGESEISGLQKISPQKKYILIPNGQDQKSLEHKSIPLDKNNKTIFGFCGRIDIHTKGLDLLLTAFAQWNQKADKNVSLWIVGDGEERNELATLAKTLKIAEDVTFLGSQFGAEKLNTIAQMDVFFHPSRNEGIPTAVLEASGLGVPSIVSPESNLASIINAYKAGIGIEKNDIEHLSAAMEEMYRQLQQGAAKTFQENGKYMIHDFFNWEYIAQQLIGNYKHQL